jgi:hypothetical protein
MASNHIGEKRRGGPSGATERFANPAPDAALDRIEPIVEKVGVTLGRWLRKLATMRVLLCGFLLTWHRAAQNGGAGWA